MKIENHEDFNRVFGPLFPEANAMAICDCGHREFYVVLKFAGDNRICGLYCGECHNAMRVPFQANEG